MKSLKELYRLGIGPSSSHTMGPRFAAEAFKASARHAVRVRVTLYGSLAATGRGHLTELAVSAPFSPTPVDILWLPGKVLPRHPNGIQFESIDESGRVTAACVRYSVGGGALLDEDGKPDGTDEVYQNTKAPILKLALFDKDTKKSLFYIWANTEAMRIGLNLGWVQVGLKRKDARVAYGFGDAPKTAAATPAK